MYHARENNAGWRIDYFLVSDRLKDSVYRADIHDKIMGSDHCPVELQIDTLVNGGIWSSERRGKSSVVSPAEKNKKENTKAGAENAKAFAAFFLVCAVLAGICLFAKGNGESQGANSGKIGDPFEVSVSYDPMQQIVKYTSIFDSTENYDPYYSDRLTDGENTYYFYYFDEATLEGANVWLKIALTDVGLEYYSKDWTLQLEPLTLKLTNADSTDQLTDFENISIAKYYTDTPYSEDPDSRPAGWMIWGHLPQDGQFRINLLDGQQVIYSFPIDLLCQSGDDSQIIEIGNVFDAAVYYTPLTEYMYIQDASPSASNLRCVFFDGNAEFFVDWTYEPLVVDDADYWIRVDLTDEGLQLLDEMNFEFSASPSDSQDSIWSSTLFVTCTREFYTDESRTQLAGWFVYGTLPQAQSGWMTLSVSNGELDLHRESVHIIPYITAEEAADMTTEDLVEYIIDHPGIQEALLLQTIVSTILDDEYYAHVVSAYPVLTELKTREDAVQCVMDWSESLDTTTKRIPDALLEYVLYPCMTDAQEVTFLTCAYSSCSRRFSIDLSTVNDPEDMTTLQIVLQVDVLGDKLYECFSKCSSQSVRLGLYMAIRSNSSLLLELEQRSDAAEALEQCSNELFADGPIPYLLEMWDEIEGISSIHYGSPE